jgi:hypothetical protein
VGEEIWPKINKIPCASGFRWKKKCMKVGRFGGRDSFWLKPSYLDNRFQHMAKI